MTRAGHDQPSADGLQTPEAIRHELEGLEDQRRVLLAEVASLRRVHRDLADEVAAAEARHARVAELTLEARERRQALAGEVVALCAERAELVERISTLRIAAMKLEADCTTALASRTIVPPVTAPPLALPEPGLAVAAADSPLRGSLLAASGRVVATWSAQARTTVKPRNDRYDTGRQVVWRRSEDRFRLASSDTGLLAAVADGAGASGLYCGNWAEALVERLPTVPLASIDDLNGWLDGFCLAFRHDQAARCKADPPKHSKFVREGSFATLTACWLQTDERGVTAHWLGYGDSPLLIFDRAGAPLTTGEAPILAAHPATLAAFDRDPHLLNWKSEPLVRHLSLGRVALPPRATVVLASDGVGQYLMLRHLAANGSVATAMGGALADEFRSLATGGAGRLAAAVKAHARCSGTGIADIRSSLGSDEAFAALVAARCEEGLLANDDSTVIMIDIDQD